MASLTTKTLMGAAVAVLSVSTLAIPASAGDLFGRHEAGSIKDAPVEAPKRRCEFSINVAGTTDYVFRGISQNGEDPAAQGGADMSCGIFYAGVWGSTVDFAPYEVDLYGGIKKDLGFAEVDLGVIYYAYPGADDLPDEAASMRREVVPIPPRVDAIPAKSILIQHHPRNLVLARLKPPHRNREIPGDDMRGSKPH